MVDDKEALEKKLREEIINAKVSWRHVVEPSLHSLAFKYLLGSIVTDSLLLNYSSLYPFVRFPFSLHETGCAIRNVCEAALVLSNWFRLHCKLIYLLS